MTKSLVDACANLFKVPGDPCSLAEQSQRDLVNEDPIASIVDAATALETTRKQPPESIPSRMVPMRHADRHPDVILMGRDHRQFGHSGRDCPEFG